MSNDEWTTLPVRKSTRERVRDLRPEDAHSVDEFVNTLLDVYDGEFDYEQEAVYARLEAIEDAVSGMGVTQEMIRESVESELSGTGVGYDDVVAASRQAIRDELPDEVFR